jgi:CRP-like cAMP-binding protein
MTDQDPIIKFINKFIPLTEAETEMCRAVFRFERLKKRQFIIQPNFIDRHKYFVIEGVIRAYVVDVQSEEHTVQLAIDEWWISDYSSDLFQQPASMFIVAMEDCRVLKISYEDEQRLKGAHLMLETYTPRTINEEYEILLSELQECNAELMHTCSN